MAVIQVPPAVGSSGQEIDSIVITSTVNRQIVVIGSPASTSGQAPVSTGGLSVLSTSVVVASGTITSTSATNPWSSAPGFNLPVVSVSSGLVQISGTPTVTATAATNPWSSAPGFNLPVVSVSSGLVQVSGNVGISSGVVTLSSVHTVTATGPVTVTSGLISVTSGTITSTAATNPWSSAPSFNVPVVAASSGATQILYSTGDGHSVFMTITSSAGNLSTTIQGAQSQLKGYSIFNTNAAARFFKFFNTTSAPTLGTATPVITLLIPGSTAGAGAVQTFERGVNFSAGLSIAITDGVQATSTGAISAGDIAANIYYV